MGTSGLPNPNRQLGGNVSFAQSLSGSQPATPLDLSYVLSTCSNRYFFAPSTHCPRSSWASTTHASLDLSAS